MNMETNHEKRAHARRKDIKTLILELLRERCRPLGAYEIVAALEEKRGKVAPTTVYRALGALIEDGRAHRVESKNAYVVRRCAAHGEAHLSDSVLSICDGCGGVEEYFDMALLRELEELIGRSGFRASRHVIEIHGRCADCGEERAR